MKRIILLILLTVLLIGCINNDNNKGSISYLDSKIYEEIIKAIQLDNQHYTLNQIKENLGEPDKIMNYLEFKELLLEKEALKELNKQAILQGKKFIREDGKVQNHSKKYEVLIYNIDNENYSLEKGFWFGLGSKKTDLIRIPYFISFEREILYGGYYFGIMTN